MSAAFENITTRVAWYAAEKLSKYEAVEFDAEGKLAKATGVGPFAGIVQYGADAEDEMATAVKGIFPAIATEDVAVGDKVTIDATEAGQFKVAGEGDAVYGTVLTAADAGDTFTLAIAEVSFTVPTEG